MIVLLVLVIYGMSLLVAITYLVRYVGVNLSLSSLAILALLVLHGPAFLHYSWGYGPGTLIFERALSNIDIDELRITLTSALAVMFLCVIAGMALVEMLCPSRARLIANMMRYWDRLPIVQVYQVTYRSLFIAIIFIVGMLAVSLMSDQIGGISTYLSTAGGEFDKIAIRHEIGGSQYYLYNLAMFSLAPFLTIAFLSGWRVSRNKLALGLGISLLLLVLLGKLATLSKAPAVIFLLQLLLSFLLFKKGKLSVSTIVLLGCAVLALFIGVTMIAIPGISITNAVAFLYYRIFLITNEVLVEYFAAIPSVIEHSWGQGIRLIAGLAGESGDFLPTYTAVAEVTRGSRDSTSTAMFIADAWSEFSWIGVALYSMAFGVLIRGIDFYAFRHGKTDEAIALVSGVSFGLFTALTTSLTTAMLSGGLVTVPLLSMLIHGRLRTPSDTREGKIVPAIV